MRSDLFTDRMKQKQRTLLLVNNMKIRILTLTLLSVLLCGFSFLMPPNFGDYKLIAHRGGVVEDKNPENSPSAIEEAISRGYWMIEVDIRETKDGIAIAQHDPD